jgi:hypothetical protein
LPSKNPPTNMKFIPLTESSPSSLSSSNIRS